MRWRINTRIEHQKELARQASARYRKAHPEKIKAISHKRCRGVRIKLDRPTRLAKKRESNRRFHTKHPEKRKEYKAKYDRDGQNKRWYREWCLKNKYNMTLKDYEVMLGKQEGLCAICCSVLKPGKDTHVDHDHETNKVRALLCSGCNVALGYMKESPERFRVAANYLEFHKFIEALC